MKNWRDYTDSHGLVIQKNGDGGDSLNRSCVRTVLEFLRTDNWLFSSAMICPALGDYDGRWRRSWHPGKWYSNYDRTSRDQLIPLLILLGLFPSNLRLSMTFISHLKRGLLFAYNTRRNFQYPTLEEHLAKSTPDVKWNYKWKIPDFTGPEIWALYIRGFKCWYFRPLLYLLDLETLVGAILIRIKSSKDDVINHALILEYSRIRFDTFWMKLSRIVTSRSLLQSRLDEFFGKEQEPPINELYRQLS